MKKSCGLIKVFRIPSGDYYAYDGATGQILTVGPRLIRKSEKATQTEVLQYLLNHHIVSGEALPGIEWECDFPHYLELIRHQIPALLLQMTRRCNLDCDYCVYSGNYAHMEPHADMDMSVETIHQSMDFFAAHSVGRPNVTVDLYGGEALLCFDKIQEVIRYAKQALPDKGIVFRITSNGVLLDSRVAQFLNVNPEIQMMLTVNGPFHDRHRKDLAGNGSLEKIMKNIYALREHFPRVWEEQIHFIANVAHGNHLSALVDFYRREIGKPPDAVTRIRGTDANEVIDRILSEESGTEIEETLRQSYCKHGDPFLEPCFGRPVRAAHNRRVFAADDVGYVGSCMPPLEKLFVHTDGRFGICETCCDKVIIGDLVHGFDEEKLRWLYEGAQQLFQTQCRTCWAQRLCTVCLKDVFEPDGTFLEHISNGFCRDSKQYALDQLRMYCEIASTQPSRLDTEYGS